MKALYLLNEQLVDELGKGIPERNSYRWTVIDNLKEAITELEQLKADYDKINDAWIDCVERYESAINKQIIQESKTCEGCKYYQEWDKGNKVTLWCVLNMDCIRKHKPKDRWESVA